MPRVTQRTPAKSSLPVAPQAVEPAQRYGFVLVPNFSLIALSSAVDPLRLANGVLERRAYEFVTVGVNAEPVRSSDGIRVLPDRTLADAGDFDAVFVVGPNPIPRRGFGEVTAWLRRMARRGVAIGGIDTGSYFLARAGLLNGYRCTIHWEDRDVLMEQFPEMIVSTHLFEIDRDRYTCSGGVSPLDLMTVLLSRSPGSRALAARVSDLLVAQQRSPDESQVVPLRHRIAGADPRLVDALEMMESNVEERLTPLEIANYLGVSRRQLERLFQAQAGTSPSHKYLEIRLERARLMVLRSQRSLDEIAAATGFASVGHFITRYRAMFGKTPASERQQRAQQNDLAG